MSYETELVDLRKRVAKLERAVDFLLNQLKLTYVDNPASVGADPDILALVQNGKKIEAIKLYRERTGVGLAEAKDFIDRLDS